MTVNDYLAQRDAEWNRPVFESLGMTVAAIETGTMKRALVESNANPTDAAVTNRNNPLSEKRAGSSTAPALTSFLSC